MLFCHLLKLNLHEVLQFDIYCVIFVKRKILLLLNIFFVPIYTKSRQVSWADG